MPAHSTSSRRPLAAALLASLLLSCGPVPAARVPPAPAGSFPLGGGPLCEASAAVRAPWDPQILLVGDDDAGDRLFAFRLGPDGLPAGQTALPLPGDVHPADVEALAAAGDELWVVGSHGRGGGLACLPAPERQRFQVVAWDPAGGRLRGVRVVETGPAWVSAVSDVGSCLDRLFTSPPPPLGREACEAIVRAEPRGERGRCVPFDVEGAAALAPGPGKGPARVWLGTRQPRVQGRSLLLRLVPQARELRFDAVVLVDAGDRGIRALAASAEHLWAVLGPPAGGGRGEASSRLWRARREAIVPGSVVAGEVVAETLPPEAEGLALDGRHALVVVDGDLGRDESGRCRRPSRVIRLRLPGPEAR